MKTVLAGLYLLILAVFLFLPMDAAASKKLAVAVLYFDNNSNNHEYDVLQKGLADMLITDLAMVEELQLVERGRIKSLLDEINLQKGRFFDAKTAQKLGHGVGARYVVTGSLEALEPQLRIDIRLIEVSTGNILVTDKVIGTKKEFFELEAKLVSRFLAGLNFKLTQNKLSGINDVATLLQYSKGLDSADRGDLQAASTQIAAVVRSSPNSTMAQARYADILNQLQRASSNRQNIFSQAEQFLWTKMNAQLQGKNIMALSGVELAKYLSYRFLRQYYLRWKLAKFINLDDSSPKDQDKICKNSNNNKTLIIPKQNREQAQKIMKLMFDNQLSLLGELTSRLPNLSLQQHDVTSLSYIRSDDFGIEGYNGFDIRDYIPTNELKNASDLGIIFDSFPAYPCKTLLSDIINFAAYGSLFHVVFANTTSSGASHCDPDPLPGIPCDRNPIVFPSILQTDPQFISTISGVLKREKAKYRGSAKNEDYVIYLTNLEAEILLSAGRKSEALAKWQEILDNFPRSQQFGKFSSKIQGFLETSAERKELINAAKTCNFEYYFNKYIKESNGYLMAHIVRNLLRWDGSGGVINFYNQSKHCKKSNFGGSTSDDRIFNPKFLHSIAVKVELDDGKCALYEDLVKAKKIKPEDYCSAICEK